LTSALSKVCLIVISVFYEGDAQIQTYLGLLLLLVVMALLSWVKPYRPDVAHYNALEFFSLVTIAVPAILGQLGGHATSIGEAPAGLTGCSVYAELIVGMNVAMFVAAVSCVGYEVYKKLTGFNVIERRYVLFALNCLPSTNTGFNAIERRAVANLAFLVTAHKHKAAIDSLLYGDDDDGDSSPGHSAPRRPGLGWQKSFKRRGSAAGSSTPQKRVLG
jgi:hypothetical protein